MYLSDICWERKRRYGYWRIGGKTCRIVRCHVLHQRYITWYPCIEFYIRNQCGSLSISHVNGKTTHKRYPMFYSVLPRGSCCELYIFWTVHYNYSLMIPYVFQVIPPSSHSSPVVPPEPRWETCSSRAWVWTTSATRETNPGPLGGRSIPTRWYRPVI